MPTKLLQAGATFLWRFLLASNYADSTAEFDLVGSIMAYEQGEMGEDETQEFFQHLIDSGLVWQLQGSYGRTAQRLIQAGICYEKIPERGHE